MDYIINQENKELIQHFYTKTLIQYMNVLNVNPDNTFALCNIGSMFALVGDDYMTMCEEADKYKSIYKIIGDNFYMDALLKYEKAIKINPKDYLSYFNIGIVYSSLEKYNEAINYYIKTLQINPEYVPAKYQITKIEDYLYTSK